MAREFDGESIPIVYDTAGTHLLSLEEVASRLGTKIYLDLHTCADMSVFEQRGYIVEKPTITLEAAEQDAHVEIDPEAVQVQLHYPLRFEKDGTVTDVSDFSVSIPIRLGALHDATQTMLGKLQATPPSTPFAIDSVCASYDMNGFTNIYLKDDGRVVQVLDFEPSPIVHNIMPTAFSFQFALEGARLTGGCTS